MSETTMKLARLSENNPKFARNDEFFKGKSLYNSGPLMWARSLMHAWLCPFSDWTEQNAKTVYTMTRAITVAEPWHLKEGEALWSNVKTKSNNLCVQSIDEVKQSFSPQRIVSETCAAVVLPLISTETSAPPGSIKEKQNKHN